MFISLKGLLIVLEGGIGPGSSTFYDGGVDIENFQLGCLLFHKFFDFLGKDLWIFFGIGLDSFEMKNVGLISFGVLVDLALGV